MKRSITFAVAATGLAATGALAQSNIDPNDKHAWAENVGWTNWRGEATPGQGVIVHATFLSGFVWAENVGWINLGDGDPGPSGGSETQYANINGTDFGVNLDAGGGDLSGMAWGENVGWLNFDGGMSATPPNAARIEAGRLRGFVWGENVGWVNLDDAIHFVALEGTVVTIVSANPPTDNPYVSGVQPYRDVLDTGTGSTLTAGIGGDGTVDQGPVSYSPISVTFSAALAAPSAENVSIACTGGTCPSITGVTGSDAGPYAITLSAPIPPGHCTTLTFASTAPGQKLQYQSQPGNVSMDAATNTQDLLSLINALNNGAANMAVNLARYNLNRSTGVNPVNTQDLLRLIQLLNGTSTTQPFNGGAAAECP